jgi:hypothetical protein
VQQWKGPLCLNVTSYPAADQQRPRGHRTASMCTDARALAGVQFGCQTIDTALVARIERLTGRPAHPFLKRGIFFAHRPVLLLLLLPGVSIACCLAVVVSAAEYRAWLSVCLW